MGSVAKLFQQAALGLMVQPHRVYHVLPAGQGAANQPVTLLHLIPLVDFQLFAGHAVPGPGGQPLGKQEPSLVQLPVPDERHHIHRGQIAHPMAVQQDFSAGIAAIKFRAALQTRFLVDPAWLPGIAHLL